ncbi:alpha-glucuronidase [Telluria mixta]|uniref:Xylan alpha-1,2-glucuronidase n=1 Tax=Telluria mixta TaxID=34071 RepID=A0ABT2C721_9BURK|nr:alpha-glucuronidase family glycosyl hydrolase [Telluria mixta]MCS0633204.1 alpha-glucuronidase [Telluria mixta]WEM94689.1 alpha-glucuronidase family glycosyl hydrolase [Telluria mixta]
MERLMRHARARLLVALALNVVLALFGTRLAHAADEDGYDLWLRYRPLPAAQRSALAAAATGITAPDDTPTVRAASAELKRGLAGMLARPQDAIPSNARARAGAVVLARATVPAGLADADAVRRDLAAAGAEGYVVRRTRQGGVPVTLIAANTDIGLLYGSFAWLRQLQLGISPDRIALVDKPALPLRVLNHWDNLDRTVERGYAGESIWNWWELPNIVDPRYTDYARANASLGINGTVLNNVNAKAEVLSPAFIAKTAAIANVLRPYGIRVYLSVRWSTPLELKETKTADPLDPAVAAWWARKADEIYRTIPDFGGFLVKANSEGQPGPQDYDRNHADGANMLARALAPHKGIVMWRAFVYNPPAHPSQGREKSGDRAAQAYDQFKPLDGKFDKNVLVQVKNGAIDFQPREPAHPLFGAMPDTPLVMEFQVTKEYLGFATHLVYLGPLFQETLRSDTRAGNKPMTVAHVLEGAQDAHVGGIAGVANIGSSRNWTGSTFDQANWYAYGRLAWNPDLDSRAIAREWAGQTFAPDARVVDPVVAMMMRSREAVVDYMTPLGLHHMMGTGHHYGPAPWVDDLGRADWNPVYYHRADRNGIGFDRTSKGSNAVAQYAPEVARRFADPATTPPEYLLWFHHLPWDYRMPDGRTLWADIIAHYDHGVAEVAAMQADWQRLRPFVDAQRFDDVAQRLAQQQREAAWWRDACIAYFQHQSGRALPAGVRAPAQSLEYYRSLSFPFAPGHG